MITLHLNVPPQWNVFSHLDLQTFEYHWIWFKLVTTIEEIYLNANGAIENTNAFVPRSNDKAQQFIDAILPAYNNYSWSQEIVSSVNSTMAIDIVESVPLFIYPVYIIETLSVHN